MSDARRYQLGLIGWPVEHSRSPVLHQAALQHAGLTGDYRLYPIPPFPEDKQALINLLEQLKKGELDGLNVTIPHKQNVIPLLNELSPAAGAIGAVNTIVCQEGHLQGDNTDAPGFIQDLKHFMTLNNIRLGGKNALVLGAGGGARAVCYALQNDGWQVNVAARRIAQAETLVETFALQQAISLGSADLTTQQPDLIVNTTPVGMHPNTEESPWPADVPLPDQAAVYDLVYNPGETQLVHQARHAGLPATTGLGMLVEQAALAFHIWTGVEVPSQVMYDALQEEMSQ